MNEMNWSQERYRLDKVADVFGLPCVVRLDCNYLALGEARKFIGNIITLDSEIAFDKVSSNVIHWDYGVLTPYMQGILLPLSYYGMVKVLKVNTTVYTVKELADIFPGYAELGEKLTIKTYDGELVTLAKGTVIELERIIPGFISEIGKVPDELVIHFKHSKQNMVAAIPFNKKGEFHTKADLTKYTIRKAIDR